MVRLKAVKKVNYVWQLSCTSSRPKPFIGLSCDLCWNAGGSWEQSSWNVGRLGLVRVPNPLLGSGLGERTPSERVILLQKLLALKMWLVPPHMAHIFGFCGTWRGPGRCQNFGKSFQIVARANLAAPPVCPLFQITFFLQDFSRFAIVFAARGCFIFVPSYFQLLQSTSTSSAHFFH